MTYGFSWANVHLLIYIWKQLQTLSFPHHLPKCYIVNATIKYDFKAKYTHVPHLAAMWGEELGTWLKRKWEDLAHNNVYATMKDSTTKPAMGLSEELSSQVRCFHIYTTDLIISDWTSHYVGYRLAHYLHWFMVVVYSAPVPIQAPPHIVHAQWARGYFVKTTCLSFPRPTVYFSMAVMHHLTLSP